MINGKRWGNQLEFRRQLRYFTCYFSFTKNIRKLLLGHLNLGQGDTFPGRASIWISKSTIQSGCSKTFLILGEEKESCENPDVAITLMNPFILLEC